MSEKLLQLKGVVSAWRKLDHQRKQESLAKLRKELSFVERGDDDELAESEGANRDLEPQAQSSSHSTVEKPHANVFEDVHLFTSSSYLYYYPTIRWSMDRTPDTDHYWIGVYEKGAPDDQYLAYHWISTVAKGSYKIGKLKTTAGKVATNRTDVFELRMFNGSKRCPEARTNQLIGAVLSTAVNPYSRRSQVTEEQIDSKGIVESSSLITAESIDGAATLEEKSESRGDSWMEKLTFGFLSDLEKGKLLHLLEQEFLSNKITDKDDEIVKRREPNREFSDLGKQQWSKSNNHSTDDANAPSKIVLEISLDHTEMYVYPSLHTSAALHLNKAWFGVYKAKRYVIIWYY